MTDEELIQYNKARWEALARANVVFSRPFLTLTRDNARDVIDPKDLLRDVRGKDVLCLASGGGQQSAAFALLEANVTVFDLSETQLQRDQETAAYYNVTIKTVQGDMSDLSCFENDSFDIIWHAFSLNFVPDVRRIFKEVARVLRVDGLYRMQYHNPFLSGLEESHWSGEGYLLKHPYVDGAEIIFEEPYWEIEQEDGSIELVEGPKEYRHALSTVTNELIKRGFVILGIWEEPQVDAPAEPGTWAHLVSFMPPWLTFWASYRPYVFANIILPR